MANSTTNIDGIVQGQGSQDLVANAFFDAASHASVYGRRASKTTGRTWGYYGGNVTKSDGTMAQIANSTLSLTASSTCYIVAKKDDGVVSFLTTTTNWNSDDYWRLYSAVTSTTAITSYTDYRQLALITGMRSGFVVPVTKTGNFTAAANENQIICNGSASITVTLPAASAFLGRVIRIKTCAAFTVVSASSNVKPLDTDTAGTAILAATAGKWAELVSDGSNWIIMAAN